MPGMILTNSAAFWPTMATFCKMRSLMRVDFSPDSVGVIWVSRLRQLRFQSSQPGLRLIPDTLRLSSELRTTDFAKPKC